MTTLILNREFKLPADGFIHAVPLGDYPVDLDEALNGHRTIVQVVDADAIAAMERAFAAEVKGENFPGLLIDYDHFSHDPEKQSRAAGWGEEIANRAAGLFLRPHWTDSGRRDVEGGDYRLVSPVFDRATLVPLGGNRFRPTRLLRLALTNDPNMKGMQPISNRRETGRSTASDPAQTNTQTMLKPETIAAILAALGLGAESTDEQVMSKLPSIAENKTKANGAEALTNRNKTLEDLLADRDLDLLGIRDDEERKAAKPLLIANRDGALALLKGREKKAAKTPLTVQNRAQTPGSTVAEGDEEARVKAQEKKAALISNRARTLRNQDSSMSLLASYQAAEAELAEVETLKD